MPDDILGKYQEKRDFEITPEPDPFVTPTTTGPLMYCIQKHAARRLHYDLRLECDGVLLSWAVPKGPSFDPKEKRIAVHVEDHPIGYATFEGIIPKGEYGGGEVIVWDNGVYAPDENGPPIWHDRDAAQKEMRQGLKKGKLSFTFIGKKLKGSFTLVKIAKSDKDWLLIKHQDEFADAEKDALADDRSVISGRTIEDVREGRAGKTLFEDVASTTGAKLAPMPKTLAPMLVTDVPKAFTKPDWVFEIKLDGIRTLAFVHNNQVKLLSRNGKDITHKFPRIALELAPLPNCILDAEIVVFDEDGKPTFQGLMERFQVQKERDIAYLDSRIKADFCVFDLLYLGEWDLRKSPWDERRARLEELNPKSPSVRVMDVFYEEGELLFEHATKMGFEGIIGKKVKSVYKDGFRTAEWVKIKNSTTEEFLIAGFTKGEGTRASTFGSLILASVNEDGKLEFCGTVGGGFSDDKLVEMRALLEPDVVKKSPFPGKIDLQGAKPTWVEPKHWAEVRYGERTRENRLRFPIFQRLRPDLAAPSENETAPAQVEEDMPPQVSRKSEVESVLLQLETDRNEILIEVEGNQVKASSLNKVLWPETEDSPAFTKRDLIAYYARMSDHLIRHLRDRPISFVRLPEGLGGERFFQKSWEKGLPEFIDTVPIYSSSNDKTKPYVLINRLSTLIWLAQMSAMEIHPWYSRVVPDAGAEDRGTDTGTSDEAMDESALNYPDFMVIDLDPNIKSGKEEDPHEPELNRAGWEQCVAVAGGVKEVLDGIGLRAYPKTSGKAGLHLYVPLERLYDYPTVKDLCETIGRFVEKQMPDKVTMEWSVKKRPEKVFFDHNQNIRGKTLSGPYTVRAVPGAPVSMPFEWKQLESIYPSEFTIRTVPAILATHKDPWAGILDDRQVIPGT